MKNLFNVVAVLLHATSAAAHAAKRTIKAEKETFLTFGRDVSKSFQHSRLPATLVAMDKEWRVSKLFRDIGTDVTSYMGGYLGFTKDPNKDQSVTLSVESDKTPPAAPSPKVESTQEPEAVQTKPMAPPSDAHRPVSQPPPSKRDFLTVDEAAAQTPTGLPPIKFGRLRS